MFPGEVGVCKGIANLFVFLDSFVIKYISLD